MKILIKDPETGNVTWEIGPELEQVIRSRSEQEQRRTIERLEALLQAFTNLLTVVGGVSMEKQDLLVDRTSKTLIGLSLTSLA